RTVPRFGSLAVPFLRRPRSFSEKLRARLVAAGRPGRLGFCRTRSPRLRLACFAVWHGVDLMGLREECTEASFAEPLPFHRRRVPAVSLLADGARPDTIAAALDSGALPALARLRAQGGLHTVTTCFPSVTGPAYAPFLLGRFPGPIGLPGLRWFDR